MSLFQELNIGLKFSFNIFMLYRDVGRSKILGGPALVAIQGPKFWGAQQYYFNTKLPKSGVLAPCPHPPVPTALYHIKKL